MFVHVCFVLCLQSDWFCGMSWQKVSIYKRRIMKCPFAYVLNLTVLRWPCIVKFQILTTNCSHCCEVQKSCTRLLSRALVARVVCVWREGWNLHIALGDRQTDLLTCAWLCGCMCLTVCVCVCVWQTDYLICICNREIKNTLHFYSKVIVFFVLLSLHRQVSCVFLTCWVRMCNPVIF